MGNQRSPLTALLACRDQAGSDRKLGHLLGIPQSTMWRIHPDDLHREVHLYGQDGCYLTQADLIADFGFADQAGAHAAKKRRKDAMRTIRAGLEATRQLSADQVAALQARTEEPEIPAASVVRPVRPALTARPIGSAALKIVEPIINENRESQARVINAVARFVGEEE